MAVSHEQLNRELRRARAPVDAAECHGALCGVLCAPEADAEMWLARVLGGIDPDATDVRALRFELLALAADLRQKLRAGDLAFAPLLPDDETPLADRTGALGEWCEGFLFGVGTARISEFDRLPPGVQEVIRDVVEIARVGVAVDGDESDEAAYAELVEYLRAGVQLVYDELNPAPPPVALGTPRGVH